MKENSDLEYKNNKDIERRTIGGSIRAVGIGSVDSGSDSPRIVGYAAKYHEFSEVLGNFREKIAPGFFDGVKSFYVRALINHDTNLVLGRSTSGTLQLYPDSIGLRVVITPPDTQWARDLMVSMRRGDISQMSFAFFMPKNRAGEKWEKAPENKVGIEWIRTLIQPLRIIDVSVVTIPAYPQTSAAVNSFTAATQARQAARRRYLRLLDLDESGEKMVAAAKAAARRHYLEMMDWK